MGPSINQLIQTDVLVIGGGAAGLRAAIEARRLNADVTILSASKIGHANNSSISHGGFSTSTLNSRDSLECFCKDAINGGGCLNSRLLVEMLSHSISAEVSALENMGVIFRRSADGSYVFQARGGHSIPRRLTTVHSSGMELLLPILKVVRQSGIVIAEGVKAVLLLKRDMHICGVLGVTRDGNWVCLGARAIVLATGGGGALFSKTTNVPWATGGGYALAYDAGLVLQDMEFVQFVLQHINDPGVPPRIPPVEQFLLSGADLLDSKGNSILKGVTSYTRDSIARAAATSIEEESGCGEGFVYLDLEKLPKSEIENISRLGAKRIRVYPAAHHFMGGVRVRDDLTTSIEGLYVAGEIMGGVHGANRLGGNALAETFVFGGKAGRLAANFAKNCSEHPVTLAHAVSSLETEFAICLGARSRASILPDILNLFGDLKTMLLTNAGVLRSESKLRGGISVLENLRTTFSQLPDPIPPEYWDWFDLSNSLKVAEMIFRAALEREESRGAHYRHDYPHINDEKWLVNICISKDLQGRMGISSEPISPSC